MDFTIPDPPSEPVSALAFNPNPAHAGRLLVASWDKTVRLYELPSPVELQSSPCRLLHTFPHEAAVLDVCWINDTLGASACVDRRVRLLNLQTGQTNVIGKHDDGGVSRVRYCKQTGLLISGSWDATLKVWEIGGQSGASLLHTVALPDKVLAMDVTPARSGSGSVVQDPTPRLVVGMAGRAVYIFELNRWRQRLDAGVAADDDEIWKPAQRRESSLKFMLRDLRCMPSGQGFAQSSVEGRIALEFFDMAASSQKYAFKCHRQPVDGVDTVYPVNAMAFHPVHGTFASIGGDGVWAIWDPTAKKRIRQYPRLPSPLSAAAMSSDGHVQVVASGFENIEDDASANLSDPQANKGGDKPEGHTSVQIHIRTGAMEECRPRAKTTTEG